MKGMETPALEMHHAATGIAGEAGEVLDLSKKVWIYGKPLDAEALIKELGDLRFYYQAMLNLLGISDGMVIAQNVKKLRARYSEGKYSDAQAIAQADKQLPPLGRDRNAPPVERKFMGKPVPRHELEARLREEEASRLIPQPPCDAAEELSEEEADRRFGQPHYGHDSE
jgi:NTP pyrophosphatase (non-canonical NTP hydrolase)